MKYNTQLYANSFLPSTTRDWNDLQIDYRNSATLELLKKKLTMILNEYQITTTLVREDSRYYTAD